jgi:hypothetical protein
MARTSFSIGSIGLRTDAPGREVIDALIAQVDELKERLSFDGVKTIGERATVARVSRIDDTLAKIERGQKRPGYFTTKRYQDDQRTLRDLLTEFSPPYIYFGSLDGEYGFIFDRESFEEAAQDGEVLKIADGDEWPSPLPDCEYVATVTDHGNLTLFTRERVELWSIV